MSDYRERPLFQVAADGTPIGRGGVCRDNHLLDAHAYLMGGQRPRGSVFSKAFHDALSAAVMPPQAMGQVCSYCNDPSAYPLDVVKNARLQVVGYICDPCKQSLAVSPAPSPNLGGSGVACHRCTRVDPTVSRKPLSNGTLSMVPFCDYCWLTYGSNAPSPNLGGSPAPAIACDRCTSVDGTARQRPAGPNISTTGHYCDHCWNNLGPNAPSPGAVMQNRPSRQYLQSYAMMPKIDPGRIINVGLDGEDDSAVLPHCGQCSPCCNGLIEQCDSYAPGAPHTVEYAVGSSRYTLALTGAWLELDGQPWTIRYWRVELPEGEQVPCHGIDNNCQNWFREGWAYKHTEHRGIGLCDACHLHDAQVMRRSR